MKASRALLVLAAGFTLAQCTCGVPGVEQDLYACRTNDDCVTGFECIGSRCRPAGTVPCEILDCKDPACDAHPCASNGRVCGGGTCSCQGNGGAPQASEAACADTFDNDCDGLPDCADDSCANAPCSSGGTCSNGVCLCPQAGGAPQTVETLCGDTFDNDCDLKTDCNDESCAGFPCGLNGRVCAADAGVCQCGGNGGMPEGSESLCADLADNDCDGLTDCGESTCNTLPCRPNGFVCVGTACTCTGNGGVVEGTEVSCTDAHDNDCDGMADCADSDCAGQSCGPGCSCGNGAKREVACTDMMDNDGDGPMDCTDSDCAGVACGMFGLACDMGTCRCTPDGGAAEAVETVCTDSADNDCDGLTDCQEPACDGLSCGPGTRVCVGMMCTCFVDGGVLEAVEVTCNDGRDNDCDGLTDCQEPSCNHKACNAAAPAAVCCGTGTNAVVCKNLAADTNNCGGCGLVCAVGCSAASSGGTPSGRCTCNGNGQCPGGQSCGGGFCACGTCAAGEMCTGAVCRYP